MKKIIVILLLSVGFVSSCGYFEDAFEKEHLDKTDLDELCLPKWSKKDLSSANTALTVAYLSKEEKEIYFYLNLVRINPPLFAATFATHYTGNNGWIKGYAFDERRDSLIRELKKLEPLPLVYPDENLYEMAHCFAYEGGKLGLSGHDRSATKCIGGNFAECIQYGGGKNGLSIIMSLLIDAGENNAALGHRRICLKNSPYIMGASIENHTRYKFNAVLDFQFDYEHIPSYIEDEFWKEYDGIYLKKEITFDDRIKGHIYKGLEESYKGFYIKRSNNGYYGYPTKIKAIQALYAYLKYDRRMPV